MTQARILLVEDDPTWQVAVDTLLSSLPGYELVAVVDNYDGAMAAFEAHKPDIVLLDWQIHGEKDGLAVGAALLAKDFPKNRMILVTGSDPAELPPHPFRLVPKPRIASDLAYALEEVAGGGKITELAGNGNI